MLESRCNEGLSICLSYGVNSFNLQVGHGSKARAHKLSNAMEFNPVIPPRATQTYSMQKKCENNL